MDENEVPEWLLKVAREIDLFIRSGMSLSQSLRFAKRASLLSEREIAFAMEIGMRELLKTSYDQRSAIVHAGVATASGTAPPVSVVASDMIVMTETALVQKGSPSDPGMPLDAKTVFLAILWVLTILLPLKEGLLPPEVQTKLWEFITIVNFTLTIHWRVTDSRKRD